MAKCKRITQAFAPTITSHTVIGQVAFENGICHLGETTLATINYMYWQLFAELLKPGLTYEVREGSRIVGKVEILSVENPLHAPNTCNTKENTNKLIDQKFQKIKL